MRKASGLVQQGFESFEVERGEPAGACVMKAASQLAAMRRRTWKYCSVREEIQRDRYCDLLLQRVQTESEVRSREEREVARVSRSHGVAMLPQFDRAAMLDLCERVKDPQTQVLVDESNWLVFVLPGGDRVELSPSTERQRWIMREAEK
jgi:hypothetical protein